MARTDLSIGDILGLLFGSGGAAKLAAEPPRAVNPLFDPVFYAATNPHVVKGGIDLHDHYSYFGCRNGYDPNPYFQSAWYVAQYEDVAATGANPLDHYYERGVVEGRNPSPAFSTWLYLLAYPDVREAGMNPLLHYIQNGRAEGRVAPPVCLLPALDTLLHKATDEVDLGSRDATEQWLHWVHDWSGRLLERARTEA